MLWLLASTTTVDAATTWIVCPQLDAAKECRFEGLGGLQAAIDGARDGDTIRLRAGRYVPAAVRDVPFQDLKIRGAVVIDGRRLSIHGDEGVVFDGAAGVPSSAVVTRGGHVSLRGLKIQGFRAADPEDNVYDGHGLFFIDAEARVDDVTIVGIAKMALTGRGASTLDVRDFQILDGHVGIWLEETASLTLARATVRNNYSAGICAYGRSTARIRNSTFESNRDDGLYTEGQASIDVEGSDVVRNAPYGMRATGESRIQARNNRLLENATGATANEGNGQVIVTN